MIFEAFALFACLLALGNLVPQLIASRPKKHVND